MSLQNTEHQGKHPLGPDETGQETKNQDCYLQVDLRTAFHRVSHLARQTQSKRKAWRPTVKRLKTKHAVCLNTIGS